MIVQLIQNIQTIIIKTKKGIIKFNIYKDIIKTLKRLYFIKRKLLKSDSKKNKNQKK